MTMPTDKEKKETIQESEAMTYRQLLAHISTMDDSQLDTNVTVYNTYEDEYYPVPAIDYVSEDGNGVLDPLHPFLVVDG